MVEPSVTVVVVSYNTKELLRRCLESVVGYPAIVVDNASADGSADMVESEFPAVSLVRNRCNRGFGAANNVGLELVTTAFALLLNSDAYVHQGAIQLLSEAMRDGVVAAGGRLEHPDGRLQESAAGRLTLWAVFCEQTGLEKLFPASRLFSRYWMSARLPQGGEVEQVMGACLLMRRVDGEFLRFDERIFLYCEDTELCYRLRRHGRIRYVPQAVFTHELGASSSAMRWKSVALYNRGKELYFLWHHGWPAMITCWMMNRLGALLRVVLFGFATPKARVFWRVLFARNAGAG